MPQIQLPIFPEGVTPITAELAFQKRDGQVVYFNGQMPVFIHDEDDIQTFRMITSQFVINGNAMQCEIAKAFGIPEVSVRRAVKKYREKGPRGFYEPRKTRGAAVLTDEVLGTAQGFLDEQMSLKDISEKLGIKTNTLNKAIRAGKLHRVKKKAPTCTRELTTASQRNEQDSIAPMGMGATNTLERVAARLGMISEVALRFEPCADVVYGGVLLALPALLACGLLGSARRYFGLPKGYYGLESIFLLLAMMALARVTSIEQLRYEVPGEWGKLLGLDRIPEARTLRNKIKLLVAQDVAGWSAEMARTWMYQEPESAGLLYVDGHVRVYHGQQTKLPRHYVARQRLCLRATTDYWVNAMDGQPFFRVTRPVDDGLLKVLEHEIVPRLEADLEDRRCPETEERLPEEVALEHPYMSLIYDREGYSPGFMARLRMRGIACITYHKHADESWSEEEFHVESVKLVSGESVEMRLAERGVCVGVKGVWMREIRKLSESGHQTSVLCTHTGLSAAEMGAAIFARWCQENFFKYMREHFGLDRLMSYSLDEISDDTHVVNPAYRAMDGKVRSQVAIVSKRKAEFASLVLTKEIEAGAMAAFEFKKASLQEEIEKLEEAVKDLKAQRKRIARYIKISELPQADRFKSLCQDSKHFIDVIKMVAYRAETAMAVTIRQLLARPEDARATLQAIYQSPADLIPNEDDKTLIVRIHHRANHQTSRAVADLIEQLNETKTTFPGTDLRLVYEFVRAPKTNDVLTPSVERELQSPA